ncbi:PorT family protein [Dysgonomonas capnocytophagoides]|uniref:PorT family protein n=1 Tax=Dysgonomonas capnocytophagoides TaxID=45254 RepID=A0A4Y8KY76_9BACT|nr:porin family protein [Dysgonomonas capnocytophagoides]TFD95387.1 PorT family protein [Dysgonomonas capnocytophagoides]
MKKLLLISLLLLSVSLQSYGQNKFTPEWNIGVGFGPTFSSMSIVPTSTKLNFKTQSMMQYQGGISVRYISDKNVGLIGELNYSQMGWETKFADETLVANKHQHMLNYISIPLLTHIYFGDKTRFFFNLGPQIGILLSDKEKTNDAFDEWLVTADTTVYSTDLYGLKAQKKIDYGIIAGMGVEIRTGIGNFALEGRYYMGFGDIYNNKKQDPYSRSANRVISAKLTYYIKAF